MAPEEGLVMDQAEARAEDPRALYTTHLSLRPARAGDLLTLHAHWNRWKVRRFLWDGQPVSRSRVEAVIARSATDFEESEYGLWRIDDRASGDFRGACGFRRVEGHGLVEILYSLEPEWWGRGLTTEAARAVIDYGFERAGLSRIVGGVDDGNDASVAVLLKLGMTWLGVLVVEGDPVNYYELARPSET